MTIDEPDIDRPYNNTEDLQEEIEPTLQQAQVSPITKTNEEVSIEYRDIKLHLASSKLRVDELGVIALSLYHKIKKGNGDNKEGSYLG